MISPRFVSFHRMAGDDVHIQLILYILYYILIAFMNINLLPKKAQAANNLLYVNVTMLCNIENIEKILREPLYW